MYTKGLEQTRNAFKIILSFSLLFGYSLSGVLLE